MLRTVFIICVISNFGYAAFHGHTWDSAIEHTLFQGCALIMVWFAQLSGFFDKEKKEKEEWVPPKGPIREPKRGDPDFIDSIDS